MRRVPRAIRMAHLCRNSTGHVDRPNGANESRELGGGVTSESRTESIASDFLLKRLKVSRRLGVSVLPVFFEASPSPPSLLPVLLQALSACALY